MFDRGSIGEQGPESWSDQVSAAAADQRPQAATKHGVDAGVQCKLGIAGAPNGSGESSQQGGRVSVAGEEGGGVHQVEVAGAGREEQGGGRGAGEGGERCKGLVALVEVLQGHASDVAHDLKNPLNGVLALSQNVLQVSGYFFVRGV